MDTVSLIGHRFIIKPSMTCCIRELHCVQLDSRDVSVWNLNGFKCLSKIRLDWLSPFMMPHYSTSDPADRLPFIHVSSLVKELDIRGLPWPSPLVFHNIQIILPDLAILKLRQPRIWCGLCHTCSVVKFRAPGPEVIVYHGGLGLPVHSSSSSLLNILLTCGNGQMHYARAFLSLKHLHTVQITIADFGSGKTTLSDDREHNKDLWAGECDRCMEIMYEDDVFRARWVARKRGIANEKDTAATVYVAPPSLKKVEWRFWKADNEEELEIQESGDEVSSSGEDA